jgi:hypothetical protein
VKERETERKTERQRERKRETYLSRSSAVHRHRFALRDPQPNNITLVALVRRHHLRRAQLAVLGSAGEDVVAKHYHKTIVVVRHQLLLAAPYGMPKPVLLLLDHQRDALPYGLDLAGVLLPLLRQPVEVGLGDGVEQALEMPSVRRLHNYEYLLHPGIIELLNVDKNDRLGGAVEVDDGEQRAVRVGGREEGRVEPGCGNDCSLNGRAVSEAGVVLSWLELRADS